MTVAERARQPLYMVSAGELGTSSQEVEKALTTILDLAYRWNAILLLDESDVFLEQRSSDNLQRNQLVSGRDSPRSSTINKFCQKTNSMCIDQFSFECSNTTAAFSS